MIYSLSLSPSSSPPKSPLALLTSETEIERSRESTKARERKRKMSEKNQNLNRKRDASDSGFEEASSISISPLKKKKLDDSHVVVSSSSSMASSADSASGFRFSVTSAGEDDEQSSSISSGCFITESNEIVMKNPAFVTDLEAPKISETETDSTFVTRNFRKERNPVNGALGETTETKSSSATEKTDDRKTPTPVEIEEFFSELEDGDKQKRFIEKYNFDIVNDKPLEGRYKWDRLNP